MGTDVRTNTTRQDREEWLLAVLRNIHRYGRLGFDGERLATLAANAIYLNERERRVA